MRVAVLIPAYKPDKALISLIHSVKNKQMNSIIVVRDGGGSEYDNIFDEASNLGCVVLVHRENLGKGAALKTGFDYFIKNSIYNNFVGIVTVDADGQHLAEDISRVSRKLESDKNSLVLGVRNFNQSIPLRSKIGNLVTRKLFSFLVGKKVSDTQTGLRGIPRIYLESFCKLSGQRYEYEMNMLIATRKLAINVIEVPIETVYIDNNSSSHFNPFLDSIKIYYLIFSFFIASFATFLLDYVLFVVLYTTSHNLFVSNYGSRVVSMLVNYSVNKKIIFASDKKHKIALLQYLVLATFSISVSFGVLYITKALFNLSTSEVLVLKTLVEFVLAIFNFYIQNKLIFSQKYKKNTI